MVTPVTGLSDADRGVIARAAELAELRTTAAVQERFPGWGDSTAAAYAEAFGVARYLLAELAVIAGRCGGELGDALERIRALEDGTPQARQLQLEADQAAADLAASGYDRHGRGCGCPYCP